MKLHKLAIAVLFAGGMIGASASMASAAPLKTTSCAVGYEAVENGEDSMYDCVPIAETFDEGTTDGTCWTTPEGGDVCARGGAPGSTEEPVPTDLCYDATDADGNFIGNVCEISAYNTLPTDGEVDPCQETPEMCEMTVGAVDDSLMYKNYSLAGSADGSSSNTLAALGVLFGALGAFGIGLSNQKSAKK
jgi:hypothetical protein